MVNYRLVYENGDMYNKNVSRLIALLPLLSVYRSPISGIDIGTVLLFIIAFKYFLKNKGLYTKKHNPYNWLMIYIFLTTVINISAFAFTDNLQYASVTITILRLMKLIMVLFFVFTLDLFQYMDFKEIIGTLEKTVFVNSGFIVIQRCSYQLLGRIIANPLVRIATNEAYADSRYNMLIGQYIRPSGFFLEPSHFAQYCSVYLCYILFLDRRLNFKRILIVTIGIILSGSGMGILMLVLLVGISLIIHLKKRLITTTLYIVIYTGAVLFFGKSGFINSILGRVFTNENLYGGNAVRARIGNGYRIFESLNALNKVFGCGYGHVPNSIYLNGWAYVLNTLGILGVLVFGLVAVYTFIKTKSWGRWVIVCYLLLMAGAQLFTASSIVYFLGIPLLYNRYYEKENDTVSFTNNKEVDLISEYL